MPSFRPGSHKDSGRLPCSSHPDECRFPTPGNPSVNFLEQRGTSQHERFERPGHPGAWFYDLCPVRRGRQHHLPAHRRLAVRPHVWLAALGFLITAVGLPVITVIALAKVGGSVDALSHPIGRYAGRPAGGGLLPGGRPAVRHSAHRHGVLRGRRGAAARRERHGAVRLQPGVLPPRPGHLPLPRSPAGHRRTLPRPAEDPRPGDSRRRRLPLARRPDWHGPAGVHPGRVLPGFRQRLPDHGHPRRAGLPASSSSTPSVPAACSRRG